MKKRKSIAPTQCEPATVQSKRSPTHAKHATKPIIKSILE